METELTVKDIDIILAVIEDWFLEWGGGITISRRQYDISEVVRKLEDLKEEKENADCH